MGMSIETGANMGIQLRSIAKESMYGGGDAGSRVSWSQAESR